MIDTRPHYLLQHVTEPESGDPAAVVPVLFRPWETPVSRRSFLGVSLGATSLLIGSDIASSRLAETARAARRSVAPGKAGGWVDPELLSMVGIASSGDPGSVEAGFHLRWFSSVFPPEAFPRDRCTIEDLLKPNAPPALVFDNRLPPRTILRRSRAPGTPRDSLECPKPEPVRDEPGGKKDGINHGVPTAFLVYRREHFPHFDYDARVDGAVLKKARAVFGHPFGPGTRLFLTRFPLGKLIAALPEAEWRRYGTTREDALRWARNRQGQRLLIRFTQPNGVGTRTVHFLRLSFTAPASLSGPSPLLVVGYGEDPEEPVRRTIVAWKRGPGGQWGAEVRYVQGHYHRIELLSEEIRPFGLSLSFMDEDLRTADPDHVPQPGEWLLIQSIPFITAFQTWSAAKNELFRHALINRYLEFSGAGVPTTWDGRLDFKYAHLFSEMQRTFLRIGYSRLLNRPFLEELRRGRLTGIRYKPEQFLQLWCVDPIIATMLSQLYADTPGQHNPHPPTLGKTYDYLVTTAWQPHPMQRLCYIAQKVSKETTPAMKAPSHMNGLQGPGLHAEGGQLQYRTVVQWRRPEGGGVDDDGGDFGYYEPPLYDVGRGDTAASFEILTHRFDPAATTLEDRIIDAPLHPVISPPSGAPVAHAWSLACPPAVTSPTPSSAIPTQVQQDALVVQQALQARDSTVELTASAVFAHRTMMAASIEQFFQLAEAPIDFTEWLPLAPTVKERTVYYRARAVDLFGRTSEWLGPQAVKVTHATEPPEVTDLTAARTGSGLAERLQVSWRMGPKQLQSGAPVKEFRVLWKDHDPRQRSRCFDNWQANVLDTVPYVAPVAGTLRAAVDLPTQGLSGRIDPAAVTAATRPEEIAAEVAALGGCSPATIQRAVLVPTDQCWWGPSPLPGVSDGHGPFGTPNVAFDGLSFLINNQTLTVVSLIGGAVLKLGIAVQVPSISADPVQAFRTIIGAARDFTLRFNTFVSAITWDQGLGVLSLSEIGVDEELPDLAPGTYTDEDVAVFTGRGTLRVAVTRPFAAEISGRESWLDGSAWLEYSYTLASGATGTRQVPIADYDLIRVSHSALYFGTVPDVGLAAALGLDHQTRTLAIRNGGPRSLFISSVTVSTGPFNVVGPGGSMIVPPGGAAEVMVRFVPTATGCATGVLTVTGGPGQSITIPLSGTANGVASELRPDPRGTTERHFLAGLTLEQVILDADAAENPTPVFPAALLKEALNTSSGRILQCALRLPVRLVTLECSGAADAARMDLVCGADLAFVQAPDPAEYVCDVVSRPVLVGTAGSLRRSFVLRPTRLVTGEPVAPPINGPCTVHPVYRRTLGLPSSYVDDPAQPPSAKRPGALAIAVSVHRDPPIDDEARSLVSTPVAVRMPGRKAVEPVVQAPPLPTHTWVDPFVAAYAGPPKFLDGRWVVQYKVDLADTAIVGPSIPAVPTGGALEVYRAPQDAIRLLILDQKKPLIASTNPATRPDDPADPTLAQFNAMTAEEEYRAIATRLANTWGSGQYSPAGVFRPVGLVTDPTRRQLVDEIDTVAGGNIFYAVRGAHAGAVPSSLQLLSFKLVIPDRTPPAAPIAANGFPQAGRAVIRWTRSSDDTVTGYELYRAAPGSGSSDVRGMNLIRSITHVGADAQPTLHFAPLVIDRTARELRSRQGVVGPWFPPDNFLALRGIVDLAAFQRSAEPLTTQSAANLYNGSVTYTPTTGLISGIADPTAVGGVGAPLAIVFGTRRLMTITNPFSVQSGSVDLPRIQQVLGLYHAWNFATGAQPIDAQPGFNLLPAASVSSHAINGVRVADGEPLAMVFRDTSHGLAVLQGLTPEDGRTWIPFGPRLLDVIAAYDVTDTQQATDLIAAGATFDQANLRLNNVGLSNGARVRLVVATEDYAWVSVAELNAVRLPRNAATGILGLVTADRFNIGAIPDPVPTADNLLAGGETIEESSLFFPPKAAAGTAVALVVSTSVGSRSEVRSNDTQFQIADTPPGLEKWIYRVVSTRTNGVDTLRSRPTGVIEVVVR